MLVLLNDHIRKALALLFDAAAQDSAELEPLRVRLDDQVALISERLLLYDGEGLCAGGRLPRKLMVMVRRG